MTRFITKADQKVLEALIAQDIWTDEEHEIVIGWRPSLLETVKERDRLWLRVRQLETELRVAEYED